jgi:putative ABC transport system permease protein
MPRDFKFAPYWATKAELWAPLVLDGRRDDRSGSSLRVFARLRSGVQVTRARNEMSALAAQLAKAYPGTDQGVTVVPLHEKVVGAVRPRLMILFAAVGLVLLIACANVAHLQLVRATARQKEIAVRSALGASGGRIIRQSLTESAILSAAGAAAGIALAYVAVPILAALSPPDIPRLETIRIDADVFLFMTAITLVAAMVSGIAPALKISRGDLNDTLKEATRGSAESFRTNRMRSLLVASEFALALVLLVGAGLILRSFFALLSVDAGFDPRDVLSMQLSLKGTRQAEPDRRAGFFRELVDRVEALPGVESASAINHLPLHGDNWYLSFSVEGRPLVPPGERSRMLFRVVLPGYFRTMRIPVQSGRDFSDQDQGEAARSVIINEYMARFHWPGESPIGKRVSVDDPARRPDWFTIVGVVKNVRQAEWTEADAEEMYFPYREMHGQGSSEAIGDRLLNPTHMTLVIRTPLGAAGLTSAVESIVRSLDSDVPVSDVITMRQAIGEQISEPRFYVLLLGAFASIAVTLAAVGIYGVLSYAVARRTHEIGIRLALGAGQAEVFRLVVAQGMRLASLGGAAGLAAAFVVTPFLRRLMFGVQPTDPTSFVLVTILLAAVALTACWIPARRASRVDPMIALRTE